MMYDDVYELGIHQCAYLKTIGIYVLRVPGGWIYWSHRAEMEMGVFVPYLDKNMAETDAAH